MKQLTQAQYDSLVGFLKYFTQEQNKQNMYSVSYIETVAENKGLLELVDDDEYKLADWIKKL